MHTARIVVGLLGVLTCLIGGIHGGLELKYGLWPWTAMIWAISYTIVVNSIP
jgi:hypothetical protein